MTLAMPVKPTQLSDTQLPPGVMRDQRKLAE
jgi:hypothetical protein